MDLAMHVHGLPGRHHDRLFHLAALRAEAALGRLTDRVSRVILRLSDENGPKGGRARRCVATVELSSGRRLVASDLSTDWADALTRTLERAASMVKRLVDRRRSLERR